MAFLNQSISVLGSITITCYILYTVSADVVECIGSHYLYTTSVFVLAGIRHDALAIRVAKHCCMDIMKKRKSSLFVSNNMNEKTAPPGRDVGASPHEVLEAKGGQENRPRDSLTAPLRVSRR